MPPLKSTTSPPSAATDQSPTPISLSATMPPRTDTIPAIAATSQMSRKLISFRGKTRTNKNRQSRECGLALGAELDDIGGVVDQQAAIVRGEAPVGQVQPRKSVRTPLGVEVAAGNFGGVAFVEKQETSGEELANEIEVNANSAGIVVEHLLESGLYVRATGKL